jgi:hypothetical protein
MKVSTKPSSPFRSSEFFRTFDWEALDTFMIEPPFVPPPLKDEPPVEIPPLPASMVSAAMSDQGPAKASHYLESTMASRVQQATNVYKNQKDTNTDTEQISHSSPIEELMKNCPYTGPQDIFDGF